MKTFNQKILAIIFVLIGILLLLVNIGLISLEIKEYFVKYYPVLFVLLGLKFLMDTLFYHRRALFLSVFLIAFGVLLLLDRVGYLEFEFNMFWKLWPLLIVYFGVKLFINKRPVKVSFTKGDADIGDFFDSAEEGQYKESKEMGAKKVITIGDMKMNEQNWAVEPLTVWNVVGDYYFDFSKAYIPDKETNIQIKGVVADLKMLIPEDLPIRVAAKVKIGQLNILGNTSEGKGNKLFYESPNYEEATRKLNIVLDMKIGDVRIDRV
ncbi:cell wall-active antibiotics response protein LiaF [Sutcliffiella horikoshii]|uniref:cell wall-active antibiotics response protein LiaF n=1 Tax=Sutcliffiella horikoshii TaxID=79883 RepID=UPI0007D059AC|nr:cell wall-active antibiotics response protein LiaF [Sutcliffiella horikoshii]MCM3616975.1 cell wall-active antibiotics response protein LiaF [Sutcliffiella horikoshii]